MPFLGMGFPVRPISGWLPALEHFICQPEFVLQTAHELGWRSRKFGRVSASCEIVEVGCERSPQAWHDKVGTAMPDGSKSMIDNDPVGGFHHNEIVEGKHYRREGFLDVSWQRPRVLKEILIIKALAGEQ